ncbi:MAG: prolyl-tRNA synthetase [Candidatus Taylorbacteria bacterium]|nr:prolyl-tRNA synthetase [Candidatus Taylorbacteria bacterium]
MLQSKLFTKTRKEAPKDEVSKNAQLLIRAGFIHKEMAGVYSLLPLGLRVMNKISNIIRHEMNAIGGEELYLTVLQDKNIWEKTDRWDDAKVDNWFKTKLKNETELGLGFTHEEQLTALMRDYIRSWRDLPVYTYQIQTKFRNETRAKSGIMRGREFLMKDLYSFTKDEATHKAFYEQAKGAYKNIFEKVGLGDKTYMTFASGGSFSKYSHEFQTLTDAGEDIIFVCEKCKVAINKEIINDVSSCPECTNKDLVEKKSVEVGNIFTLGTRFSEALDLMYQNESGDKKHVFMGSYGIGPGRLMGTIVELFSDAAGIVWPEAVTPYKVHLVSVGSDKTDVKKYADSLYQKCLDKHIEVLYDDRDTRPGDKFADSDLIGISWRVVVSEKLLAEKMVEIKNRKTGEVKKLNEKELFVSLGQ